MAKRKWKNLFVSGGPTAYLAKMNEDVKVNKYLATENLPMVILTCTGDSGIG